MLHEIWNDSSLALFCVFFFYMENKIQLFNSSLKHLNIFSFGR